MSGRGFYGGGKMSMAAPTTGTVCCEKSAGDVDEAQTAPPPPAVTGTVEIGRVTCGSGLDTAGVKDAVTAKLAELEQAYALVLAATPGLRGRLALRFTIGTDGKATGFSTDRNTVGSVLAQAVINIIKAIEFDQPARNAKVSLPLEFHF
jgi:outer membrane biosynthesis protein TonB